MKKQVLLKLIKVVFLTAFFTSTDHSLMAQPEINGPGCIIPGTTYEYLITGLWDSSSNTRVCITGGALTGGDTCISFGVSPSMMLLVWNYGMTERKIEASSDLGNVSVEINGTSELAGGVIDDTDEVQVFSPDQSVYTFHCSTPTGGSCHPNYNYQWQSSSNQLNWTDIQTATGKDLLYSAMITETTYFRRVTTETNSNILAYANSGQLIMAY